MIEICIGSHRKARGGMKTALAVNFLISLWPKRYLTKCMSKIYNKLNQRRINYIIVFLKSPMEEIAFLVS